MPAYAPPPGFYLLALSALTVLVLNVHSGLYGIFGRGRPGVWRLWCAWAQIVAAAALRIPALAEWFSNRQEAAPTASGEAAIGLGSIGLLALPGILALVSTMYGRRALREAGTPAAAAERPNP